MTFRGTKIPVFFWEQKNIELLEFRNYRGIRLDLWLRILFLVTFSHEILAKPPPFALVVLQNPNLNPFGWTLLYVKLGNPLIK
mgnify:CR=1 FL=1